MFISRRLLLGLSSVLTLPPLRSLFAAPVTTRRDLRDPYISLTAFVDVLIPRDDAPSASDVGVDVRIMRKAADIPAYAKLLLHGCAWLDSTARELDASVAYFRDLEEDTRIRVVELAEASKEKSVGLVFFRNVRADAMRFYYTSPAAWPALGYGGPPQPEGFLDFDRPPAKRQP